MCMHFCHIFIRKPIEIHEHEQQKRFIKSDGPAASCCLYQEG